MQINKYLASTLLAGLFVTVSALSPALGQEQSLQPSGNWAVTRVDSKTPGGNAYCTLSRKYEDGVILSLGRNQTEEYSLAIDFQKPVFKKDKSMKVNLQPGPGQVRSYDMMPTSEKALVVRLGWDNGFFESLNQSEQMKVKLADKSYSFSMPQIAKGQDDLQECMEGLKAAAKGGQPASKAAQSKDVLNAEPVKTSKAFNAGKVDDKITVASAESDASDSADEPSKALSKNVDDTSSAEIMNSARKIPEDDAPGRRNFAKLKGEEADAARAKIVVKNNVPRPPEDVSEADVAATIKPASGEDDAVVTAKAEKPVEKAAPAIVAHDAAPSQDVAAMQKHMGDLKAENASLKQSAGKDTPETQKKIADLEAEKKMLQERLDLAKQQDMAKVDKDVMEAQERAKELEIKNAQLEDSLRQTQVRIGEAAINTETKSIRKITDLETKLDAAQKDNIALAKQLDELKLKQENGTLTAVSGNWDLEQATQRYNESQREITRLSQQVEAQKNTCSVEKTKIEQMLFDPAVTDKKQIEHLNELQSQLQAANDKLNNQQKLIQPQVDAQVATKMQAVNAEKTSLTQQIATLQKSLAEKDAGVSAEKTALQTQLNTLQKNLADKTAGVGAEKAAMQTQISTLQKTLAEKEAAAIADKTAMQAQLSALQKNAGANQTAAAEKTALQTQLSAMQKTLADKDAAALAERTAFQTQIATLQKTATENQIAAGDKAKLNEQLAALQKNAGAKDAAVNAEKASLQSQIDSLKTALVQKDQQLASLQAQPKIDPAAVDQRIAQEVGKVRAASDQEASAIKAQNKALSDSIESMKVALASKDKALIEAQAAPKTDPAVTKQLADYQSALNDLKRNNDALRDQNVLIRTEADKLNMKLAQAQNTGAATANTVASAQQQAEDLKRQIATRDSQTAAYQGQLASLQQENAQLKNQLAVSGSAQASNTAQVTDMTRQIQGLQSQVADLQRANQASVSQAAAAQAAAVAAQAAAAQAAAAPRPTTAGQTSMATQYSNIQPAAGGAQMGYVSPSAMIAQPSVPLPPPTVQAVALTSPAPVAAVPVPQQVQGTGYSASNIQGLLQRSGLSISGLQKASGGLSGADGFSWIDGSNIKGTASVKMMSGNDFDSLVNQYIAYQKGQCSGDFASVPSPSNGSAAKRMSLYEIACVSSSQSLSSSLIFFEDQGRFIAISNQIGAADMDLAMDSRDKIAGFVRGL